MTPNGPSSRVASHAMAAQSVADAIADQVLNALAFSRRQLARAAAFGTPASMTAAAILGVGLCIVSLATWPATHPAMASYAPVAVETDMTPISAPAPMGAPPAAPVQLALDYDVAFFWPNTPQTVAEPVAIRDGPADYAKVIRPARPGERLRINGVVVEAPDGPWFRVRLEDGRDGYFAAEPVEIGQFRRRRAEERALEAAGAPSAPPVALGAPLIVAGPSGEPDGPPSF
ncbi:MAG: SH3 domain-containing protein [Hyphomonadaceae bacterium]|nr:SH3 domain-containing protein [Hyphomonadaceae bacterium]